MNIGFSKKSFFLLSIFILCLIFILRLLPASKQERRHEGLNISCFIYFDKNRNGIYDIPDQPYAGLPLIISRPDQTRYSTKSNISGFANFKMSLDNTEQPIHQAGAYFVHAEIPEKWQITSKNESQELNFKMLDGSPAGIILSKTCDPIGVTQELTLSGLVNLEDHDPSAPLQSIKVISPDGQVVNIDIKDNGQYTTPVISGDWILKWATKKRKFSRKITVDDTPVYISSLKNQEIKEAVYTGDSITLQFDELTTSDTLYEIPNGYGQLNWTNWIATHNKFYNGYGYVNGTVSKEFMAYNSSGHPAEIWGNEPFDFIGTYISVAWPKAEAGYINVQGWQGDRLIYTDQLLANTKGPIYFDADYQNITKLVFSTEKYWQLIIDDFIYRLSE